MSPQHLETQLKEMNTKVVALEITFKGIENDLSIKQVQNLLNKDLSFQILTKNQLERALQALDTF